jgi:hypothetical protein
LTNFEASSTVVIFASGDKCEPIDAVPRTTFKGGLQGTDGCIGDVSSSELSNVLANVLDRDRAVGVTVRSVTSVSSDALELKEYAECDDDAEFGTSRDCRLCWCVLRLAMLSCGRSSNFILRAAAREPICLSCDMVGD